ncbi:TMV resistance protein N-like [Rosa rugosa]|uniref:TMV resistance protein N-like n=1 Tax=Rosa rugosa TaxID=74645 RepID=UPI002B4057DB|nr:TMV resistance protein N-like [Rosa rugosa]
MIEEHDLSSSKQDFVLAPSPQSSFASPDQCSLEKHSRSVPRERSLTYLWPRGRSLTVTRTLLLLASFASTRFAAIFICSRLLLQNCTSLVEIHPSLGFLNKLVNLNMKYCKSIESLPPFVALECLQILRLSLCSGLKKFPEIEGDMKSLLELHLDGTSIKELPPSIERLTGLTMLNLTDCKNLLHLPNTIGCLTSLKSLFLVDCSKIDEIPENLNGMKCLEILAIGGTSVRELSFIVGMKNLQYLFCGGCKCLVSESYKALASLSNLRELDLSYCNLMDGAILNDFSSLISLRRLFLSGNRFVLLPESIYQLSKLEILDLSNCRQLQLLPKKLPYSLQEVYAHDCTSLKDYPNQIKVLESRESGVTIVNSLNSSALGVSPSPLSIGVARTETELMNLSVTHEHTEGKQVDKVPVTNPTFLDQVGSLSHNKNGAYIYNSILFLILLVNYC